MGNLQKLKLIGIEPTRFKYIYLFIGLLNLKYMIDFVFPLPVQTGMI